MSRPITTLGFFYRKDNARAKIWERKILRWLEREHSSVTIDHIKPEALIVLGGDGTILEATRKFRKVNPLVIGLNLGHVGFLASARDPGQFFSAITSLLQGKYHIVKRLMLSATVMRNGKKVFATDSLNDIAVEHPLGIVELEVGIDGHPLQYIRGSGVLVATATGSTAYNLSAHGPVIMPDIKCFVVTELNDHNTPTPSVVVRRNRTVYVKVAHFRKMGLLTVAATGKPAEVLLVSDSDTIFPLEQGDVIIVSRSKNLVKFAEFTPHYFLKSLQEKFGFR